MAFGWQGGWEVCEVLTGVLRIVVDRKENNYDSVLWDGNVVLATTDAVVVHSAELFPILQREKMG